LLIISKSFAVGGGGGGGAPVFAFLCLGFCGLYSFFVFLLLLLSLRSGALAHRMTDFLVAVLFDANVDEEVDVEDVKDNAARMFYLLLLLLL
jgi:phosphoglycerol transferase MdoB-like AlkP superfamily enzyme